MLKGRFDYEVRMRIFILVMAGFLIVAELGMFSLFRQTEAALIDEFDKRLSFTGFLAKEEIESALTPHPKDFLSKEWITPLQKRLKTLSLASQFTRIFLIDTKGRILLDSHDPEIYLRERFDWEEGLEGYRSGIEELKGEPLTLSLEGSRVYFLPVQVEKGVPWVIGVRSDASFLTIVNRLSRFNLLMKGAGLALVLILAFLFIASILKPYRRMRAAALGVGEMGKEEEEPTFVVRTFEKVIEELKKKEAILRERYEEEQKRAQSLEDYNLYILSSVTSGIIGVDREGQITCFNRAASQILGLDGEGMLGRPYREVLGKSELARILREAVEEKRTCSRREVSLSDERGWVGATSSLLEDSYGAFQGATLLFTDITRIKGLEAEIRLKERLASLGEMSAGIAHEFKNSLGVIIGFAHLLQKKEKQSDEGGAKHKGRREKKEEIVNQILKESVALNDVVNHFLDFARPTHLHLEEVDVNQLVRECCQPDSGEPTGAGPPKVDAFPVDLHIEDGLPFIEGDRGLLKRVFFNLVQNAKEAMPNGGSLTLRTRTISRASAVEIICKDTGFGISEENLKQVFTPFYSTREGGVGLGLSLVHKIITAHQGKIRIESQVGKGTKVTIELPIKNG